MFFLHSYVHSGPQMVKKGVVNAACNLLLMYNQEDNEKLEVFRASTDKYPYNINYSEVYDFSLAYLDKSYSQNLYYDTTFDKLTDNDLENVNQGRTELEYIGTE